MVGRMGLATKQLKDQKGIHQTLTVWGKACPPNPTELEEIGVNQNKFHTLYN